MVAAAALLLTALRFAWPPGAAAQVELTDERSVGDDRRTIVMTMKLQVEPDAGTDRVVVRLSDARLVSVDGSAPGDIDPGDTLLAVGRVMKCITPTMVVGRDGRYLGTRDLDQLARAVLAAAGLPPLPMGGEAFSQLLGDVAAEDWSTWVGAWLGSTLEPGEGEDSERNMQLGGATVPVRLSRRGLTPSEANGRTRLEASAVYPSDAVRKSTQGLLIDMARDAKELGDSPEISMRFIETAKFSPLTVTLTTELETSTMRPLVAERLRTFSAVKGRHKVEGRERRVHRFTWSAE